MASNSNEKENKSVIYRDANSKRFMVFMGDVIIALMVFTFPAIIVAKGLYDFILDCFIVAKGLYNFILDCFHDFTNITHLEKDIWMRLIKILFMCLVIAFLVSNPIGWTTSFLLVIALAAAGLYCLLSQAFIPTQKEIKENQKVIDPKNKHSDVQEIELMSLGNSQNGQQIEGDTSDARSSKFGK